jgi:hypothetical protein
LLVALSHLEFTMKSLIVASLALAVALPAMNSAALAHAGGLDKNGCHNNATTKLYECHQGTLKGQTFKSKDEAEKALKTAQTSSPKAQQQQQSATPPAARRPAPGPIR